MQTITKNLPQAVAEERAKAGLSQAKTAREIGISETRLSQYLSGDYQKKVSPQAVEELEAKIAHWLNSRQTRRDNQSELPTAPEYFETSISKRVQATLTYAQMANDLVVIYGGAGLGKTKTIARYKSQNPNTWVIEATPTTATMGGILRAIAKATGTGAVSGQNDALETAIKERIKDTNGLLIIDEAQFLNERGLECARRICELANVGLALVGNETVYGQLTGRNRAAEFAQLFSRIGKRCRLTRPAAHDVDAMANAWRIENRQSQKMLQDIAAKPGALRMVNKVLRMASIIAQGAAIEHQHIQYAWRDLGGES